MKRDTLMVAVPMINGRSDEYEALRAILTKIRDARAIPVGRKVVTKTEYDFSELSHWWERESIDEWVNSLSGAELGATIYEVECEILE